MEIGPPRPPRRAPSYFSAEHHGVARRQCARNLMNQLAEWARFPGALPGEAPYLAIEDVTMNA